MVATDAGAITPAETGRAFPRTRTGRFGAWLLAVSPLYFVAVIVTNLVVLAPNGIGPFAGITRAQMDTIDVGWAVMNIVFALATILGTVGTLLVATSLRRAPGATRALAWASIVCAGVAIVLYLPYAPVRIAAAGFAQDRLGENPLYAAWDTAGIIGADFAIAALALLCAAAYTGTQHRTAALVIGGLTVVLLVTAILGIMLPPFVISFLWCALGIVWLRAARRAARGGRARSASAALE